MKTIIVDDERLARVELENLLGHHPDIEVVASCANAHEALVEIEDKRPDLIFLDIQMPEKTGFDLLEELDYVPQVIFVTAYDDYAIKAFEVNALDYVLKPVDEDRLEQALNRVRQIHQSIKEESTTTTSTGEQKLELNERIFLKDGEKCWFVTLKDVRMFESEGNYVRVYFDRFKPLVLKSLNNLEKRLDEKDFFRINRKFIVNLKEIVHIEPWFNGGMQIEMKTGESLEVSRRQSARFKDLMSL